MKKRDEIYMGGKDSDRNTKIGWNQPWNWLYAVSFLDMFGASMIMPVFSTHLRTQGISHANIGLMSSLYGTFQLVSGPIVGSWSDVNGRKPVLCLSLVICSLSYGLMGIISSFHLFLLVRCALGTIKHTQTLCRAFVSDVVPVERQASVLGLINAFTSFSFMIGPVISGHIMEKENGFQYIASTVSLIFILNTVVVFLFASSYQHKETSSTNNSFLNSSTKVLKELYSIEWSRFWTLFIMKFLFSLSIALFFQNMGVILTENYNTTPRFMGYTISFYGFVSVISNLSTGSIKRLEMFPKTHLKSLTYIFLLMTVTYCLLFIVDSYILFLIGLIPLASCQALSRTFLTEVLLEQSSNGSQGSMVGASSSLAAITRTLAPVLSGLIISWGGVSVVLIFSAIIAASASFLTILYSEQIHEKLE